MNLLVGSVGREVFQGAAGGSGGGRHVPGVYRVLGDRVPVRCGRPPVEGHARRGCRKAQIRYSARGTGVRHYRAELRPVTSTYAIGGLQNYTNVEDISLRWSSKHNDCGWRLEIKARF